MRAGVEEGSSTSTPRIQPHHLQTPVLPAAPHVGACPVGVAVRAVECLVRVLAVRVCEERDVARRLDESGERGEERKSHKHGEARHGEQAGGEPVGGEPVGRKS